MDDTNDKNSILTSTKKLLGISKEYDQFDLDIIMHINAAFNTLTQLGVGPDDGFEITDENDLWSDFTGNNKLLNAVKTYVYMKVRLIFDPPSSSWVAESMNKMIAEAEFRLGVTADNGGEGN